MRPPLACKNCRARKKKCDRAYPVCSSCLRTHDRCEYRIDGYPNQTRRRAGSVESLPIQKGNFQKALFNATMFLGYPNQMPSSSALPDSICIGTDLREYVFANRPPRQYVAEYINIADSWMPFMPQQELRTRLSSEASQLKGEEVLLLACIKMITDPLPEDDASNKQYLAVKLTFVNAEIDGVPSVRLLQALLLLLIYEYGHGMYPCAYMTLGACTRYLAALGIKTDPCCVGPTSWIAVESRRRLWWSIYVMERIMALGCPQHPLLLNEPDENQILPSDDISWRQEYPSSQSCLTLLSPASSDMGTFRLLVHAGYLIGRVIQLISDKCSPQQFLSERVSQLCRTIRALMNVLEVETRSSIVSVSVARSILNSSLFVLFSVFDEEEVQLELLQDLGHPLAISAETCLDRARIFLSGNHGSVNTSSPFLMNWGFQAFRYYYTRYHRDGHSESLKALQDLRRGLEVFDERWKVASAYMVLLNEFQA